MIRFRRGQKRREMRDPIEVADLIERFVNGTGTDPWEWDDFVSVPIPDPRLESIRQRCASLADDFPANAPGSYCGPEGENVLRDVIRELRGDSGGEADGM